MGVIMAMKSWLIGALVVCGLLTAAWGISAVMGEVYGSTDLPSNTAQTASSASSGCGMSGGKGGCCGSGSSAQSPEELASAYYIEKTGDSDFTVTIEDFGCHQEAKIVKDGIVVMELQVSGGQVTEI